MSVLALRRTTWTNIGLDVGSSALRIVQLRRDGAGYALTAAQEMEFPQTDNPGGSLAAHILAAKRAVRLVGRNVCVGLSAPDIEFHPLDLPANAINVRSRTADLVQAELERLVTGIAGPLETRHWLLPASPSAPPAIGVAVERSTATKLAGACSEVGLHCQSVVPAAASFAGFLRLLRPWKPKEIWGALDIGARQARLVLCIDAVPVLVRQAGAGSDAWTARIAEALAVSPRAAEVHKRDCGVAPAKAGGEELSRGELASLILGAIRRDLLDLAAEVKRSYEYVMRCFPGNSPGELVLIGGGSLLRNLPSFLADSLGIKVAVASSYIGREGCLLTPGKTCRQPLATFAGAIGVVVEEGA